MYISCVVVMYEAHAVDDLIKSTSSMFMSRNFQTIGRWNY